MEAGHGKNACHGMYVYYSIEEYRISVKYISDHCNDGETLAGTIKVHAVVAIKNREVAVRDISGCCSVLM